jgi:hypothetical protein
MLGVELSIVDGFKLLAKQPKMLIIVMNMLIMGYFGYKIQQLESNQAELSSSARYIDLENSEQYNEFYTSVMKEIKQKEYNKKMFITDLGEKCNKKASNACFGNLMTIRQDGNYMVGSIYFVSTCYYIPNKDKSECISFKDKKYQEEIRLPIGYYLSIKNRSIPCKEENMNDLENMYGSNLRAYNKILNVDIEDMSFCIFRDKLQEEVFILTQIKGHDALRTVDNQNIGCNDRYCLQESMQTLIDIESIL